MSNTYTEKQLRKSTLKYFNGDLFASNIWINKYALKKDERYIELNPDDTIKRMTNELLRIEKKFPNSLTYNEIYTSLKNFKYFIFGGSILFGLGNPNNVSLANCFFINNESDSYGGIFNTDESVAQLMKRRGGVGITLEYLRPKFASVKNSAQNSTGAVSFMSRFSNTTREVAQDGRRGALMISMGLHPNLDDFIVIKKNLSKITGANISVKITDEFMIAAKDNQDFYLRWPTIQKESYKINEEEQMPYNLIRKKEDGSYVKRIKAKELWDSIIAMAHKNAEPGVLFWDSIIKESPADMYADEGFETQGTNPCGELPLSDKGSCILGSINLFSMVQKPFTENARMNWPKLAKYTKIAQRLMDDIISLEEEKIKNIIKKIEKDPEPLDIKITELNLWKSILKILKKGRRIGIGILGLGDTFAALGIRYGTPKATKLGEEIQKVIAINCYRESVKLAKERGSFPIWNVDKETGNPFLMRVISKNFDNKEYEEYLKYGRRNIANITIPPTGSISILAGVTSGIEPIFKCFYYRKRKINPNDPSVKSTFIDQSGDHWEEYYVIHRLFKNWALKEGINPDTLKEKDLDYLVELSPWNGSESHNIDYLEKINMQGAIQKWVDHSISSTINLPKNISLEKVNDIYYKAWEVGCKGCTIYRDGSRSGILSSKKEEENNEFKETTSPKRPKSLPADYYIATAKGSKFAVIIGLYEGKPYEIFAFENPPFSVKNTSGEVIKIKKGHYKFINGEFEINNLELAAERVEERSLTLTCSAMLRHGVPITYVNKLITKIDENVSSFSSVIRRYLSKYIEDHEIDGEICPNCQDKLITEAGCVRCVNIDCKYERCF